MANCKCGKPLATSTAMLCFDCFNSCLVSDAPKNSVEFASDPDKAWKGLTPSAKKALLRLSWHSLCEADARDIASMPEEEIHKLGRAVAEVFYKMIPTK